MTRRRRAALHAAFLPLIVILGFTAACGGPSRAAPVSPGKPLSLAAYYWPGGYWIDIANDKGWFREAGLDVRIVDSNADYFASITSFAEGGIDVAEPTLFDVILHQARGADLAVVAVSDISTGVDGIGARRGIRSTADLKGRRVGVAKGTYSEYLLNVVMRRQGIPMSAVSLVEMTPEAAPAVLARGDVDAVVTWEPILTQAAAKAGGAKIWDTSDIPGISPSTLATHRSLIRDRPEDIQRLVGVWHRATVFLVEQPAAAYAIVARVNRKTPEEVAALARVDRLVGLAENLSMFSYSEGFESIHGTARVINDFLLKQGQVTRRVNTAELMEPRFLKVLQ